MLTSFDVTSVNICECIHVDRKLFWGLLWNCAGSWRAWRLCFMQLVHLCLIHLLLGAMNTVISVFLILIETEKKSCCSYKYLYFAFNLQYKLQVHKLLHFLTSVTE